MDEATNPSAFGLLASSTTQKPKRRSLKIAWAVVDEATNPLALATVLAVRLPIENPRLATAADGP